MGASYGGVIMGKSNMPGRDDIDEARQRGEELKDKGQKTAQETAKKGREAADKARDWSETGMDAKQGNQPQ